MAVVSLTVHRNTALKRELHRVSGSLLANAKTISSQKGVAGFALVAWAADGRTTVAYEEGGPYPTKLVPALVEQELSRRLLPPVDVSGERDPGA